MVVRKGIALVLATVALAVLPASAPAAFHLMKISEVSAGNPLGSGDFVELQMFSPGQNLLGGHELVIYNAAGTPQPLISLTGVPGAAPTQTTILIGDATGIAGGVTPDIATPMTIPAAGGAVCFPDAAPPDCVAWGTFSGSLTPPVAPNAPALAAGQSLSRSIAPGCATLLESADDTDSSAADFALGSPTPRPSSVAPTEAACGGAGGGAGGGADTDAPQTEITKKPKKKSEKAKAKFKFTANEEGSRFECKLDRGRFKGCRSPKTYKHLDPGKHKFSVFATDAAGNADASPATYRFKVVED